MRLTTILRVNLELLFLDIDGVDQAEVREHLPDLFLIPAGEEVLHVDVVGEALDFLGVLGVKFNGLDGAEITAADDCICVLLALEADETVADGLAGDSLIDHEKLLALFVGLLLEDGGQRNLCRFDGADLREGLLNSLGCPVLGDRPQENILLEVHNVLLSTDQVLVEGESAAMPYLVLSVSDLEVLNSLGNSGEVLLVYLDDSIDQR